jgi:DNA-binding FadR family transcriptional regulator
MGKHIEIADSLTRDILVGQYRTGERLPSERDLATRFDANRGAVREAMKKLEQLGIADIQPGGARVAPLKEASLDVIGHLLAVGELPDRKLVDQILEVIDALVRLAVESTLANASDEAIEELRTYVAPLIDQDLAQDVYMNAQMALFGAIMAASDNLVCQIIARSVLAQLMPRMAGLHEYWQIDTQAHATYARQLDRALAIRDLDAILEVFVASAKLSHASYMRAFASYEAAQVPAAQTEAAL